MIRPHCPPSQPPHSLNMLAFASLVALLPAFLAVSHAAPAQAPMNGTMAPPPPGQFRLACAPMLALADLFLYSHPRSWRCGHVSFGACARVRAQERL